MPAPMNPMALRLGVDIGGTFTDLVLEVGRDAYSVKVLTTPQTPEEAILQGVSQVCAKAQVRPADIEQSWHDARD